MRSLVLPLAVLLGVAALTLPFASGASARKAHTPRAVAQEERGSGNVYAGQPDMKEDELVRFVQALPAFRSWVRATGEQAHPVVRQGKADFQYSPAAAEWVKARGWNPVRFFCVMGRTAAGLYLVSEGSDIKTSASDMPKVSTAETTLIQKHLGELLKAGTEGTQGNGAPQQK